MLLWGDGMSVDIKGKNSIRILCYVALLSATALVLSVFENMLPPLPFVLPGMKLGISNLAVMVSLEICPLPCAFGIVLVKGFFALLTRGATAFCMSVAGGLLATLGMYLLLKQNVLKFGCLGVGVWGAFLHNCGQLLVAYILVSDAVFVYFPLLCCASVVTGGMTGLVYHIVLPYVYKVPLLGKL